MVPHRFNPTDERLFNNSKRKPQQLSSNHPLAFEVGLYLHCHPQNLASESRINSKVRMNFFDHRTQLLLLVILISNKRRTEWAAAISTDDLCNSYSGYGVLGRIACDTFKHGPTHERVAILKFSVVGLILPRSCQVSQAVQMRLKK
jgi:hypothetical protein